MSSASKHKSGFEPGHDGEVLVDALAQSAFVVMGVLNRLATEHDLSLTQLRVFGILRDRTPRMSELAQFLGLDKSTMSGLVERAERRGLLERVKNPVDSRATDVTMTAAGKALANRIHGEFQQALTPLTGHLGAADRRTLSRLLHHMLEPGDDRS